MQPWISVWDVCLPVVSRTGSTSVWYLSTKRQKNVAICGPGPRPNVIHVIRFQCILNGSWLQRHLDLWLDHSGTYVKARCKLGLWTFLFHCVGVRISAAFNALLGLCIQPKIVLGTLQLFLNEHLHSITSPDADSTSVLEGLIRGQASSCVLSTRHTLQWTKCQ